MSKRTTWLSLAGAAAATAVGVIIVWLMRTKEHAVVVVKATTASGVVVAAVGSTAVSDKVAWPKVAFLMPTQQTKLVQDRGTEMVKLLAENKTDGAMKLFDQYRAATPAETPETLNGLLLATFHDKVNPTTRQAVLTELCQRYPVQETMPDTDLRIAAAIDRALWYKTSGTIDPQYTARLLPLLVKQLASSSTDQKPLLTGLLAAFRSEDKPPEAQVAAVQNILGQIEQSLPAETLPVDVTHFRVAGELCQTFRWVGQNDMCLKYYRALMARLQDGQHPKEADVLFQAMASTATQHQDVEQMAQLIAISGQALPPSAVTNMARSMQAKMEPEQLSGFYRQLLIEHSPAADPIATALLADSPKSKSLDDIVQDHLQLVSYGVEAGSATPAVLDHLAKEFRGRNAEAQINQVTEFLWRTFPTEPAGVQAFQLWARQQTDAAGQARLAVVGRDLRATYPNAPITQATEAVGTWLLMERGQALQALMRVYQQTHQGTAEASPNLSLGSLNELIDAYITTMQPYGFADDRDSIATKVADQMLELKEWPMAAALYWQVLNHVKAIAIDPRSGLPFDPPTLGQDDPKSAQIAATFWHVQNLIRKGNKDEVVVVLQQLVDMSDTDDLAQVGRLMLAEELNARKKPAEAWDCLQKLSRDLLQSTRGSALYAQLARQVPQQLQQDSRTKRLETLRQQLAAHPRDPGNDAVLMELGDLLMLDKRFADAAMHYEQVIRDYPDSRLCPEALYRVISLYRQQLNNETRATEYQTALKTRFPNNRFTQLIGR